jgi:hypothetical protein
MNIERWFCILLYFIQYPKQNKTFWKVRVVQAAQLPVTEVLLNYESLANRLCTENRSLALVHP